MNLQDLGRRAVACKHWRWMPGMLLLPHVDGCECCEDRNFPRRAARLPAVFTTDIDVPDLSDPATLGCLVALVEEAWKCPIDMSFAGACRFDVDAEERVYPQDHTVSFAAKTRVKALVAALEAAP